MTRTNPTIARVSHTFSASAERVYDAWLDPATAGKWLFATPDGEMVRVEIDPRVGGGFFITERRDGEDVEHVGVFLELTRPRRTVFTLQVPKYSQDRDRVTVEIAQRGTGCDLTITHEMSPELPADTKQMAERGWSGVLAGLARALGEDGAR